MTKTHVLKMDFVCIYAFVFGFVAAVDVDVVRSNCDYVIALLS